MNVYQIDPRNCLTEKSAQGRAIGVTLSRLFPGMDLKVLYFYASGSKPIVSGSIRSLIIATQRCANVYFYTYTSESPTEFPNTGGNSTMTHGER